MAPLFFERLKDYLESVANGLATSAKSAAVFPNSTDMGTLREGAYAEFLQNHVPKTCNVDFGGYIFGEDGDESKQIDIIVTAGTTPRFGLKIGTINRIFSMIEGVLAVASIKSDLNKETLYDSLDNISSIPKNIPLESRVNPILTIRDYQDWPYKIIYAHKGLSAQTIIKHLIEYYDNNQISESRKPNLIHVCNDYIIYRAVDYMETEIFQKETGLSTPAIPGNFYPISINSDITGILSVISNIQQKAVAAQHIMYPYHTLINRMPR